MLNTDKENPLNQIIRGRDIFYVVGKKDVDDRLFPKMENGREGKWEKENGEVLHGLPKAQKAFHFSPEMKKMNGIDIGLLIVDIPRWEILTSTNTLEYDSVCPIELPDKG